MAGAASDGPALKAAGARACPATAPSCKLSLALATKWCRSARAEHPSVRSIRSSPPQAASGRAPLRCAIATLTNRIPSGLLHVWEAEIRDRSFDLATQCTLQGRVRPNARAHRLHPHSIAEHRSLRRGHGREPLGPWTEV